VNTAFKKLRGEEMRTTPHSTVLSTLIKLTFIVTLGVLTIFAVTPTASAVDVFTDPVGFITLNITGSGVSQYSFLGMGMTQIVTNRGVLIGAPSSNNVPVALSSLTPGMFNPSDNGPAYFVELTSGAKAGLQDDIIGNDASTLYTLDNLSGLGILTGDSYKVLPHWTLSNVFGRSDETGLLGGNAPGIADNVLLFNPVTGGSSTYYFRTNVPTVGTAFCPGGGCGWRSSGSAIAGATNTVLYLEQGVMVKRVSATGTNLLLVGGVKLGQTLSVVVGVPGGTKYNLFGNVYPVTNSTLGASGLFTGNSVTGLLGGNSPGIADNVIIPNGTGGFNNYYFRTNVPTVGTAFCPGGSCGWRDSGSAITDRSGIGFPLGGSFFVLRRPATNFNWIVGQPFANP
jgi:uncharacterized protein (TIGR02597 family)